MTACGLCWTDCALLIYGDEQVWADASKEWQARNGEAHQAFAARAGAAVIGAHELEPTSTATSIRGTRPARSWRRRRDSAVTT